MIWPCDIFWGGGIFWCCSPPGGSNWAIFITPVYSTTELVQLAANYISIDGVNIFEMEKYRLMNNKLHLKVKATEWQLFITLGKLVAEPQLIRKTIGSHAVNQSATGPETGNRRQSAIWIKSGSATTSNRRRWISRSGLYRTAFNPQLGSKAVQQPTEAVRCGFFFYGTAFNPQFWLKNEWIGNVKVWFTCA